MLAWWGVGVKLALLIACASSKNVMVHARDGSKAVAEGRQPLKDRVAELMTDGGGEEALMKLFERQRFREARRATLEMGTEVRGFYHTSAWQKHWRDIVTEQLHMIDGFNQSFPSLLRLVDQLQVTIASSNGDYRTMRDHIESLNLRFKKRLRFVHNATIDRTAYRDASEATKQELRRRTPRELLSAGEYATIMSMHGYCRQRVAEGRSAYVFYFHNKGGCCPKSPPSPVSDWRDEMNAFNLEFPSICLRAMNQGYSTCGAEYQFYGGGHYSGNFFWANCRHIAKLPPLWDPLDNSWDAEFFLFKVKEFADEQKFAERCGFNPFHCRVNHYGERCPREKYRRVIKELLAPDTLPLLNRDAPINCIK